MLGQVGVSDTLDLLFDLRDEDAEILANVNVAFKDLEHLVNYGGYELHLIVFKLLLLLEFTVHFSCQFV